MKQKNILRTTLLAVAGSLSFATAAVAADAASSAPMPASGSMGLLGQTYAGLTYSYVDLSRTSIHADDYAFELNQALTPGFDAVFNYDYAQTGLVLGDRPTDQNIGAALRAFST